MSRTARSSSSLASMNRASVAEVARERRRRRLAHLRDPEREDEPAERRRLGALERGDDVLRALLRELALRARASLRGRLRLLPGAERHGVQVREVPDEAALDEARSELLAEPLDVHRAARGEVAEPPDELRGAGGAGAALDLLALLAHDLRAAHRALGGKRERPLLAGAPLLERLHDLGDDLARAADEDPVAHEDVLAPHLVLVVERRARHHRAGDPDRARRPRPA